MSYKALYREWRPVSFDELIGQDHVTVTLKNSIAMDKITHAYLFCGPRGTGKTSAAKLLAKGLNCNEGPTHNPCGLCECCKSIDDGRFFDVIEIDAASNRGIDEIREIRDQVVYPPSDGKYKVYIIDEVHMLTQEAFNALLKTLEEPPSYIIFILATTEPHKLPMTILSRCQRFDFHRLSVKDIINRLEKVVNDNNITYEEKALYTIARNAEGGMRDALSLLDQCLVYSDTKVLKNEHVLGIIGSVNEDILYKLVKAVIDMDVNSALAIVKDINDQGKDINQFFKDLMNYFRDTLLVNIGGQDEELIKGSYDNLSQLSSYFKKNELIGIIDFISEKQKELRWSQNQRLILEMTLFRLINRDKIFSELQDQIETLKERISNLEKEEAKTIASQAPETVNVVNDSGMDVLTNESTQVNENSDVNEDAVVGLNEAEVTIAEVSSAWPEILKALKKEKIYAHAYLVEGKPMEMKNSVLYIGFMPQHSIHMERAAKKENKDVIEQVIEKWFPGTKVKFKLISESESPKNEKKN